MRCPRSANKTWGSPLAGLLIALALFCVYGFMASFESGPAGRLVFKIGYMVVGLGSLAGSAWALMKE